MAEKVLIVDKSLVGIEEACVKGIGDKLGGLVTESYLGEMRDLPLHVRLVDR